MAPHTLPATAARWLLSLGLAAAALASTAAWADPPARVGRVAWLAGEVTLRPAPDASPGPAQQNWPVTGGNVLATGSAGRAEVWIGSSALRLDVNTEVQVDQLDDAQLRLRLNRGSLALRSATPEAARETSVDAGPGRFTPAEPGEFRLDVQGNAIAAQAWRGGLLIAGGGSSLTLQAGQRALASPVPGGGANFTLQTPVSDDFQGFVQSRDAAFDGRTATRYVSPEMTGIEDLDSHGSWAQTADYGAVWVPAVAPDWAPYRFGHWAWVAPWGWTWVDDAPWGFAPFHYGRWAMWGGRWCWVPGTYVARPVYAPALVAWSGPAPGLSVSVASVGWFPLAPHEVYVPPYAVSTAYVRQVNATHVVVTASVHLAAPAHYVFQNDVRAATLASSTVFTHRLPVARHLVPMGGPLEQRGLVGGVPPGVLAHGAAPVGVPRPGRGPVLHEPAWAHAHPREEEAVRRERREREALAERRRVEGHRE
jgi:hypothetical protein